MFCSKCGTQINDGDKFCGSCGTPVNQEPQQPAANEPTAPLGEIRDVKVPISAIQPVINEPPIAEPTPEVAPVEQPVVNNQPTNTVTPQPVSKTNPNTVIIAIAAIALIAIVVFVFLKVNDEDKGNGNNNNNNNNSYNTSDITKPTPSPDNGSGTVTPTTNTVSFDGYTVEAPSGFTGSYDATIGYQLTNTPTTILVNLKPLGAPFYALKTVIPDLKAELISNGLNVGDGTLKTIAGTEVIVFEGVQDGINMVMAIVPVNSNSADSMLVLTANKKNTYEYDILNQFIPAVVNAKYNPSASKVAPAEDTSVNITKDNFKFD